MASTTAPAVDPRLPRAAAVADGMDVGESSRQGDNHPFAGDGGDASASASASKRKTRTLAQQVKALDVYEDAVQEPLLECSNLAGMYYTAQEIGSTRPDAKVLREDFCSSGELRQGKRKVVLFCSANVGMLTALMSRTHRAQPSWPRHG